MEEKEENNFEYDTCHPDYVPSQGTFFFESINFFSKFDSGNLLNVALISLILF